MPSWIRRIFKIATAACSFSRPCSACIRFLPKLFAAGYQGQAFRKALAKARPHFEIEIVKRPDHAKGFEVVPRRWIVERTLRLLCVRHSIKLCLQTLFD